MEVTMSYSYAGINKVARKVRRAIKYGVPVITITSRRAIRDQALDTTLPYYPHDVRIPDQLVVRSEGGFRFSSLTEKVPSGIVRTHTIKDGEYTVTEQGGKL